MQPQKDDFTIRLPITFDYKGGRADRRKSKGIWTVVLVFLFLLIFVGTLRADKDAFQKLAVIFIAFGIDTCLLRFLIWREYTFSDAYESLKEQDYVPSTSSFWTIYEVEDKYPHICHFKDGTKGIFVSFVKDVVVGKPETVMFDHYEAIGNAYQIAGSTNVNIRQIDYMDNIGNDPRLNALFDGLSDCDNENLRDILFDIYSNLGFQMSQDYASYDVYLFTSKSRDDDFWYNVKRVLDVMIQSNYLSYKVLGKDGLRQLVMALFNLKDFSVTDACNKAFTSNSYVGLTPIALYKNDGTRIKLNDTLEEKAEKLRLAKEEEDRRRAEWKALPLKEKIKRRLSVFGVLFKLLISLIESFRKGKERKSFNTGLVRNFAENRAKNNTIVKEELASIHEKEEEEKELAKQASKSTQGKDNISQSSVELTSEEQNSDDEIDIF